MLFNESCSVDIELMNRIGRLVEIGSVQNDQIRPFRCRDLNAAERSSKENRGAQAQYYYFEYRAK